MAGVTRPEVPIMIKRVGEPTLALRSFIHKFSSHRVPRTRERESERERERERRNTGRKPSGRKREPSGLAVYSHDKRARLSLAACPLLSTTFPMLSSSFVSPRNVVTSFLTYLFLELIYVDSSYGRKYPRDNRMIERVDTRRRNCDIDSRRL